MIGWKISFNKIIVLFNGECPMSKDRIRIEKCIDFPCSIGTLEEVFPDLEKKEKKVASKENADDDGFGDFPNEDEEYITY